MDSSWLERVDITRFSLRVGRVNAQLTDGLEGYFTPSSTNPKYQPYFVPCHRNIVFTLIGNTDMTRF